MKATLRPFRRKGESQQPLLKPLALKTNKTLKP